MVVIVYLLILHVEEDGSGVGSAEGRMEGSLEEGGIFGFHKTWLLTLNWINMVQLIF